MTVAQKCAPPIPTAQRSFFVDVRSTAATQALTALLNVASLAIISRRLGSHDLGLYTLERRACALAGPIVLLGVGVATSRYIAVSLGRRSRDHRSYAITGGLLVAGTGMASAAMIVAAPRPVAAVVFGDPAEVELAHALAGFIVAASLYQIVYSIFRGYLSVWRANVLELVVIGVAPMALAAAGPTDVVAFMWALNAAILAATVLSFFPWSGSARVRPFRYLLRSVRRRGRELLVYGLPRTPGDLAVVAPFALAPIAVVHFANPAQAGQTSVVVSTLNLVSIVAGPLSILILPYVAREVGGSGVPGPMWGKLAEATLDVSVGAAALLFLASPLVVAIWFPEVPADVVTAQHVVALGVPGYIFYMVFRSYLDAVDARPLSSIATVTGLLFLAASLPLLLVLPLFSPTVAASAAVSISVTAMGVVTWWLVRTRLSAMPELREVAPPAIAALAIAALGLGLADAGTAALALAIAVAGLAYCGLLVALNRRWLVESLAALRVGARAGDRASRD